MEKTTTSGEVGSVATITCALCKYAVAKYRCPGCLLRTCSLRCVQNHKDEFGCSGQRDKTAYVPIKHFTETHLLSDYRFLEEASRKVDITHKEAYKFGHKSRPFRVCSLCVAIKPRQETQFTKTCILGWTKVKQVATFLKQARRRGVDLRLMPFPMTRRKINTSMFHYGTKSVHWRVEWLFPHEKLKFIDKGCPDTELVQQGVERQVRRHLYSHTNGDISEINSTYDPSLLQNYTVAGGQIYQVFMKAEGLPANKERYYKVQKNLSLQENLFGKRVIEFPVFHVVPLQYKHHYFVLSEGQKAVYDDLWQQCKGFGPTAPCDPLERFWMKPQYNAGLGPAACPSERL